MIDREQGQAKIMHLEQHTVERGLVDDETGEEGIPIWLIRHCESIKPRCKLWTEMTLDPNLVKLLRIRHVLHPFHTVTYLQQGKS